MTREAFIRKWLNTGYGYCEANRDLMRDDLDKVIEYAKPVDPINNDLHIPAVSYSVCDCSHTQACIRCAKSKGIDWIIIEGT